VGWGAPHLCTKNPNASALPFASRSVFVAIILCSSLGARKEKPAVSPGTPARTARPESQEGFNRARYYEPALSNRTAPLLWLPFM